MFKSCEVLKCQKQTCKRLPPHRNSFIITVFLTDKESNPNIADHKYTLFHAIDKSEATETIEEFCVHLPLRSMPECHDRELKLWLTPKPMPSASTGKDIPRTLHITRRLHVLTSRLQNFAPFDHTAEHKATVDVHACQLHALPHKRHRGVLHTTWVSVLLVRRCGAMRRP